MRYMNLLWLIAFLPVQSIAQEENPLSEAVFSNFVELYNSNEFREIFLNFSDEMKKALPREDAVDFLMGIMKESGKITDHMFLGYQSSYALYKTKFERGLLQLAISVNHDTMINGLFIKPFEMETVPEIKRNTTSMILPFIGEWYTFWGGDTYAENYHVESKSQKNAFDWVIYDENGKSYSYKGAVNEDYYAFGKEIIAPCDGEVVLVVDGVKDNVPGEMNKAYVPGNTVIIKTAENEFLFFAHFRQHTIKVNQGDSVRKGQMLGLCGNSGNSSEPHLHFHIMNSEDLNRAVGTKCYFERIVVNGEEKLEYSPVKTDKIRNADY